MGAVGVATMAHGHHPGSHAFRQPDGRVKIDAVAMAADTCSRISAIRSGTPPGVAPPPGSTPVTVVLQREGAVCAAAVTAVRAEELLDVPRGADQIFLYFQSPDGTLASTERVPIR
jgi:hypothetical protein